MYILWQGTRCLMVYLKMRGRLTECILMILVFIAWQRVFREFLILCSLPMQTISTNYWIKGSESQYQ